MKHDFFVYTFKTRNSLLTHLRGLCHLACHISNSDLPMSDFIIDYPSLMDSCLFLKRGIYTHLYISVRPLGFEFYILKNSFIERISGFSSVLQSFTITYEDGLFFLRTFRDK